MKVLQINAVYGYASTGTIVKQIQDSCNDNNISAYVAFSKGAGESNKYTYEIGSYVDHKIHALLSRIGGKQAYYSYFATKRLIRYIKRLKPDIVHLHNLHSNYINLNLLLKHIAKTKIATVVTMHDCWYFTGGCFHYANAGCLKWKKKCGNCPKQRQDTPALFYDASDKILRDRAKYLNAIPRLTLVGCSKWISDECRQSLIGSRDIRTIYNGFDLDVFHPKESRIRRELNIEDKFVVLGPASKWLSEVNSQTYEYFVNHLASDMVLVLFGCDKIDSHLPSNVIQIGFIHSKDKMAELYSMADVLVNCSREDTLSSINIEAQACGTPVVTYEATGSKETVDGKCGFYTQTGNYAELFDKVKYVNRVGKNNLKNECIQFVKEKFELNSNYLKYIDLYKELYNG
jgi:glycosyltransferase involved in cell wall biosynthesis